MRPRAAAPPAGEAVIVPFSSGLRFLEKGSMGASVGKGRTWVCDVAVAEDRARWEDAKREESVMLY